MLEIILFLCSVFVISITGVMMPGPVTATTISLGTKNKYAGAMISIGHGIIELPLILLVVSGLCDFLRTTPAKIAIGLAGGIVLLWMGYTMLKDARKEEGYTAGGLTSRAPVIAGIILSASNPYFLLWWLTVGVTFANQAAAYNWFVLAAFIFTHWIVDLIWLQFLSYAGFKGAEVMGPKVLKAVLSVCAFALTGFGLFFIFDAVRTLLS